MSVQNPLSSHASSDERLAQEPSMEEILASIRRIISDDQSLAAPREAPRAESVRTPVPEARIAAAAADDLTPNSPKWPYARPPLDVSRAAPAASAAAPAETFSRPVEQPQTLHNVVPARQPVEQLREEAPPQPVAASSPKPADVSRINSWQLPNDEDVAQPVAPPPLRRSIEPTPAAVQDDMPIVSPATDAAVATSFSALLTSQLLPTADVMAEMARDLLRPMLKTWLDDNLPVMVERLVRAEIERVARGGRSS